MAVKSSSSSLTFLRMLLSFIPICHTHAQSSNDSSYYELCSPFTCGNITFPFPFSSSHTFGSKSLDCSLPGYQIDCDSSAIPTIMISSRLYEIKNLFVSEKLVTLVDKQLIRDLDGSLCGSLRNLSILNYSIAPLVLPSWSSKLTFFKCLVEINVSQVIVNDTMDYYDCTEGYRVYLSKELRTSLVEEEEVIISPGEKPGGCEKVLVPVFGASLSRYGFLNGSGVYSRRMLFDLLSDGFPLEWPKLADCERCQLTGGRCGFDGNKGEIVCFCMGGCASVKHRKLNWQELIIGVATGSCSLVVIALLLFIFRRRTSFIFKTYCFKKKQETEDIIKAELFIKNYQSTILTNYSYHDIKKMTNGFKEKLGEGGFGNVYKGKFPDGRLIAVKMLDKSTNTSQNFISEVATIGRIHHLNIIKLLGFCWDVSKQALIYEFMPNGSLGDLLSKEEASPSIKLSKVLEIAIGVAHGIEYLHNGCESQILHLDIKPQNVLLDQNLHPKISDFGLAKVYSRNKSVVTMTGAKGTIGYIAPEIFMRNLGNPSHKSDVYSYGMLLLDVVGVKYHVEVKNSSSSEAHFPDWIYDKFIEEKDVEIIDSMITEEFSIAKKMVTVGLWCIQINPRDRPSMSKVVEMLSSSLEAIELPPKPVFFSPPRMQVENEITSFESDLSIAPLTSDSHGLQN